MDIYRHDDSFRKDGFHVIAGIDEAGRGPLAGPVVAAAVILPPDLRIKGLRDSKIVPEKDRPAMFWEILLNSIAIGIGISDHEEIDKTNILKATKAAMRQAVDDLDHLPDALIVDAVTIPEVKTRQFPIIKADAKSAAVAAASIVAKYFRDMIMMHYDLVYPEYGFGRHKGYGTQKHRDMLAKLGPCPIHRRSFRQVLLPELPFTLS